MILNILQQHTFVLLFFKNVISSWPPNPLLISLVIWSFLVPPIPLQVLILLSVSPWEVYSWRVLVLRNPCLQHCKVSTILHLLLYLSLLSLLPLLLYSSQPFTPPAACYTPVQPKASLAHPDLTLPYPPYPTLTYPTIHQTQPQQNLGLRTILYLRENNPHQRHTCNWVIVLGDEVLSFN